MKRKSLIARMRMPLPELERYYRRCREIEYESGQPLKGIKARKMAYGLARLILQMNGLVLGVKYTILENHMADTGKPIVFAVTHVARFDIETSAIIAGKPAYIFLGDPGEVYKSFDKLLLDLVGAVYVDTAYKKDRFVAKETAVKLLNQGGNLIIFPEGAWNITENEPVMPLFNGTAEMAIRSSADIIPIAIEQRGRHYYVIIGKNISSESYTLDEIQELTSVLHERLCTLKWKIWEHFAMYKRVELAENEADIYLNDIMKETENGYTVEEIIRTRFHRKVVGREEAFAFMKNLNVSRNNAFLLRKWRDCNE